LISKKYFYGLILVFLFVNLKTIFNLNDFIYLGSSQYSDIPITHYPNLLHIQNSIKQYYQIPLWSNLIFSGYPFSANPLSGLWYFPGWIALLLPLPAGINISLLLHLLIGLIGMFIFLRSLNISEIASFFGSFAMFFSAKVYAHIGAGHLSMIYAICWTPWLLYFTIKYQRQDNLKYKIIPGLFWGLILLSDLRWSIPTLFIWLVVLINKELKIRDLSKFILVSLVIGLGCSVAVWLPLLQFLGFSSRANITPSELMVFSMALKELINMVFPIFEGSAELRVYPGAAIIFLSVLGLTLTKENRPIIKWYLLALASLIFAFGENIPGMKLIYEIPGFSVMRVPSRFLFPFIFALSVISSFVLDIIIFKKISYPFKRIFYLTPILFFVILFSIGSIFFTKTFSINFFWPIFVFSGSFILIQFMFTQRFRPVIMGLGLLVFLVVDLFIVNLFSLSYVSSEKIINNNKDILVKLTSLPSKLRVYTPSYSISQEQGAFWSINQINGVDPLQINEYVYFFEKTSGIPVENYSVTLPPFKNGNPEADNFGQCPDKDSLSALNTKYVVSSFEMSKCNLGEEFQISNLFVYDLGENDNYLSFTNCKSDTDSLKLLKHTPNEILLDIKSCGGLLRLSEINYPGWNVYIDGVKGSLVADSLFREVDLSEGLHSVQFKFQPLFVFWGLGAQGIFWIFGIGILFIKSKNNEKNLV